MLFLKKLVVSIRRDNNTPCMRMYTNRSGKLSWKKTHHNEPAIMLISTVEIRKQIERLANPISRQCQLIKQSILVFKTKRRNIRGRQRLKKCCTRRNSSVKQIRKCRIKLSNEPAIMLIITVEIRKQIERRPNPISRQCQLIKQTILVFKTKRRNIRGRQRLKNC